MEETKSYELGGVRFVILDGEVYCRYADVFEEESTERDEAPSPKSASKPTEHSGKHKCSICGKPGHSRRTCTRKSEVGEKTDYIVALERADKEDREITELFESGCDFEEACETFPRVPVEKVMRLHKQFERSQSI